MGLTAQLVSRGPLLSLPAGAGLSHTCPFPGPCLPERVHSASLTFRLCPGRPGTGGLQTVLRQGQRDTPPGRCHVGPEPSPPTVGGGGHRAGALSPPLPSPFSSPVSRCTGYVHLHEIFLAVTSVTLVWECPHPIWGPAGRPSSRATPSPRLPGAPLCPQGRCRPGSWLPVFCVNSHHTCLPVCLCHRTRVPASPEGSESRKQVLPFF